MPTKQRREAGYRITFQVPIAVERIFQQNRIAYQKVFGFKPSRSEIMSMMVRSADKNRDWLKTEIGSKETNGQ